MGLWALIRMWWHWSQRRIDLKILWPQCLLAAPDLDHAKAAFAYHAMSDPAWTCLGEEAIVDFIDRLGGYQPPDRRDPGPKLQLGRSRLGRPDRAEGDQLQGLSRRDPP